MPNTYSIIFGTRPEYLKLKSIIDEFNNKNIYVDVIYVTQHEHINEDINTSYKKLTIDNNCDCRLSNIGSSILIKLPILIKDSSHIFVQGDTATAFYSSLCAFQLGKKVIHLEAGLRTYDIDKPFPEEGYRQMISRLSWIHLCPHRDSLELLNDEKVYGITMNVGNTILDLINSYNLECSMDNIAIITFHRRENWNNLDNLLIGLKKLISKTPHIKYFWYLHPNPDLQNRVKNSQIDSIQLISPSNHRDFTKSISKCNFIITDSGGIQEEASYLGKHCIVLRESTERTHIPSEYITILDDFTKLDTIYDTIPKYPLPSCNVYGYGITSKLIVDILENSKSFSNNFFNF